MMRHQHQFCVGFSTKEILNFGTRNMLQGHVFLKFLATYMCSRSHVAHVKLFFLLLCKLLAMGNCLTSGMISSSKEETSSSFPIDTIFKLPSPLPSWPAGGEFASGIIDVGGLQLRQISSFNKVWATYEGGPDNLGATFFEPSPIPDGFSMLGSYAQPNNQPLFGWVLVGITGASDQSGDILKQPTDYSLIWSESNSQTTPAYFWLPTPPDGYKAIGYVITNSSEKPSLDKIQCVRSDFTDELETDNWIWAQGTEEGGSGWNVYGTRPKTRGTNAKTLSAGTFIIQNFTGGGDNSNLPLFCLKNNNPIISSIPNLSQIQALFQTYSPLIYFHPKENYLPSSLNWYFSNGALLYEKGQESNPVPIQPNGTNLPQGGSNDGLYWIDLPADDESSKRVKKGNLQSAEAYLHVKPILGATFTDIQVWIFYPFNGPATAKVGIIERIPLGKIGEHVGDWEHVTLRISNFDGVLNKVYFAEHSGGIWVDSPLLEFQNGNKFVGYSSLNGHATYSKPGANMQGSDDVGLRNDTDKSDMVMDTGVRYWVVAAEGLGGGEAVMEPPWLNYAREWGPKISYDLGKEVKKIEKFLPGRLKSKFAKLVNSLPNEIYEEQGPTGPKMKDSWSGDER